MAYQPRTVCDSYFVEAYDDPARAIREETREREKTIKEKTQLAIADELSESASHEYGADILEHMERMEVCILWLGYVQALCLNVGPVRNLARRRVHGHSDGDSMVHASISPGFLDRSPHRILALAGDPFPHHQSPRPVLL